MPKATIQLEYPDQATAAAVAYAIAPDNKTAPAGLIVHTLQEGNIVTTDITLEGKMATFIATIDDLLEAASTAEKALHTIKPE